MRRPTISPATLCPAMPRPNACCAARRPTRSSRVQADLAQENLGLKVYDCYRPTRAVRAMAAWAHDGDDSDATKRFYPALQKRNLFRLGYIAAQSKHSTGTTVDLTLDQAAGARQRRLRSGGALWPLHRPGRANARPTTASTWAPASIASTCGATARTRRFRPSRGAGAATLNAAMRRHGFANYFREWWHFSFGAAPDPRAYDFAIGPRGR